MTLAPIEPEGLARWVAVLAPAAQLAERIAGTEFVPRAMRDNPAMVTAAIMYGDELGVGPMQALAGIHVVEGKPQPSAELMRALILRAGHSIAVHEASGTRVRVSGLRAGRPEGERLVIEWTMDMARAAGLAGRGPWRSYPRAMLTARATGDLARTLFPDVLKGLSVIAETEAMGELPEAPDSPAAELPEAPRRKTPAKRSTAPRPRIKDLPADREPSTAEHPAPDGSIDVPLPETLSGVQTQNVGPPEVSTPRPPVAPPEPGRDPDSIKPGTLKGIMASFRRIGLDATKDRETRLGITSALARRPIESTTDLRHSEALTVLGGIADIETGALAWGADPETGEVAVWPTEPDAQ
jgi:hypothetical protein